MYITESDFEYVGFSETHSRLIGVGWVRLCLPISQAARIRSVRLQTAEQGFDLQAFETGIMIPCISISVPHRARKSSPPLTSLSFPRPHKIEPCLTLRQIGGPEIPMFHKYLPGCTSRSGRISQEFSLLGYCMVRQPLPLSSRPELARLIFHPRHCGHPRLPMYE